MARPKKQNKETPQEDKKGFLDRIQEDTNKSYTYLNMVLGVLILVVLGVLLFNYFNKPKGDLGTAQQTTQETSAIVDVSKDSLPGKYTVKEGDTLYTIAQSYYGDGYLYKQLVEANKIEDEDSINVGQVIDIPRPQEAKTANPTQTLNAENSTVKVDGGTGGAVNQTEWGEKITTETYTVQEGDWLSKIAGRSYGDIYTFDKIAKANSITDPNVIEVGTVLQIPR